VFQSNQESDYVIQIIQPLSNSNAGDNQPHHTDIGKRLPIDTEIHPDEIQQVKPVEKSQSDCCRDRKIHLQPFIRFQYCDVVENLTKYEFDQCLNKKYHDEGNAEQRNYVHGLVPISKKNYRRQIHLLYNRHSLDIIIDHLMVKCGMYIRHP